MSRLRPSEHPRFAMALVWVQENGLPSFRLAIVFRVVEPDANFVEPFVNAETINARLRALTLDAQTLVKHPRSTFEASRVDNPAHTATDEHQRTLLRKDPERFEIGELIGEGGMGMVHLAKQVALGRNVAVKRLRDAHKTEHYVRDLLEEARLTGSLEHPNILPIYDLVLDADGSPVLAMKRIEGDVWTRLLSEENPRAEDDRIGFHIRILMQVANAIHFAHANGIVHRDIKPDNVMIGHFGEVYVADWGIATRIGTVNALAGTPAYMAPEMLGEGTLSARTDVYLLGAVLYEIISGAPPHDGETQEALFSSILLSQPNLPESAPEELAELVRSCMQRAPENRPESALMVRERLEEHLEHRGSAALTSHAETLLSELRKQTENDVPYTQLHNTFTEARFAFREALRTWPENRRAREGLDSAVKTMAQKELANGDVRTARALISEMVAPDNELLFELETAEKKAKIEADRILQLKKLEHEADPRTGRTTRLFLGVLLSLMWTFAPLVGHLSFPRQYEPLMSVPFSILSIAAIAVGAYFNEWGKISAHNRRLGASFGFAMVVQSAGLTALYFAHANVEMTVPLLSVFWFVVIALLSIGTDERLYVSSGAFLVCLGLSLKWPNYRYEFVAGANGIATINTAVTWSRRVVERSAVRRGH